MMAFHLTSSFQIVRRDTSCIEQIEADIHAHFINASFDVLPEERRGRRRSHLSLVMGDVRIDQFLPIGGELSAIGGNFYHVGFVMRGCIIVRRPRLDLLNVPGGVGMVDAPGRPFSFTTTPGTNACILALSPATLERAGRAILGDDFSLKDDVSIDMRNVAGLALVRNASAILQEIMELEKVGFSPLAVTSYSELLANLSIAAMFPEQLLGDEPGAAAAPRLVVKAEDLIRARAQEPLTVREIAAEVGVTIRALQLGFRKHTGCTPLQYLMNCRLLLARQRLLDPAFGGNVQYAAMSSGFMNMSRFLTRYRATFGERPSETMSRGRRP